MSDENRKHKKINLQSFHIVLIRIYWFLDIYGESCDEKPARVGAV